MPTSRLYKTKQAYYQMGNSQPLFIVIAVLAIAIGVYVQNTSNDTPAELPTFEKTIILPKPKALPDAMFKDHKGQTFGSEQLTGQWSILFFGFTNCPDVCPSTLRTLKDVKEQVSQAGLWNGYRVIMVSVDPERDTPQKLASYVPFFDPEFIGLTGNVDDTKEFAKSVGILFIKREAENAKQWYDVDHSASLILINPQGEWAGAITAPHKTDQISQDLIKLAHYNGVTKTAVATDLPVASAEKIVQPSGTENRSSLRIEKAWIRPAPKNATSLAAYFEIHNTSTEDITIVDVQSPDFDASMIHDSETKDGLIRMRHIEKLIVSAGEHVQLMPLRKHIMLIRPKSPMTLGSRAQITLISDQGERFSANIEVRQQP